MSSYADQMAKKYGALMTTNDVAHELSVSKWTVYKWTSLGADHCPIQFIKVGRSVRFRRDDVIAYVEQKAKPTVKHTGTKKAARPKPEPPRMANG